MKTIETNVHIGDDHKLMIDLPDSVSTGEYQVVLVLQPQSAGSEPAVQVEDDLPVSEIAERWKKWFEEVDKLPLPENSEEGNFHQYLIEKYRQQGLDL